MLRIDEVAHLLSMSTESVYDLVQTQQIKASEVDGQLFFIEADIEAYIVFVFSDLDDDDEYDGDV